MTLSSLIWKWTRRIAVGLIASIAVLYLGDLAVYKLRGSPEGHVRVNQTVVVPLKGNRQEYDYLGASDVPCSISIFPQSGEDACWVLRRNQNYSTKM